MIRNKIYFIWVVLLFTFIFTSCTPAESKELNFTDEIKTSTSQPTQTQLPTNVPTATPTSTLLPSATPLPTSTPILANRIPIIEYHDENFFLGNPPELQMKPEWFIEQLNFLKENGFYTLSIDELIDFINGNFTPPYPAVVLNFDIGRPLDSFFNIEETLRAYDMQGVFFLVLEIISDECGEGKICWDDVIKWQEQGTITFGCHGMYHPDYTKISFEEQLWDAQTCKAIMEEKLGVKINAFTYPYDATPTQPEKLILAAGYEIAVSGYRAPDRSVNINDSGRYSLPRYYPYSNDLLYPLMYSPYWGDAIQQTFEEMIWAGVSALE